jgi:hypothetical protein
MAVAEFADVAGEEVAFEGVGMIHVLPGALLHRQVGHVAVVGVVGQVGDAVGADLVKDAAGDGGLAGGGAAGDAENDGLGVHQGDCSRKPGKSKTAGGIVAGKQEIHENRRRILTPEFWILFL